jgi:hypothetical protein
MLNYLTKLSYFLQKMDKIFAEQDAEFNEKVDELLKKKK